MDAYGSFSKVYDLFMDNVPYDAWKDILLDFFHKYHVPRALVADLGCGTGQMTRRLAREGYDMIGIDLSCDMLDAAMEASQGEDILYLCQDMRSFELYGTVSAVVCMCDSINYLREQEELVQVFSLVNNYLDPGGIFVFDVNTRFKYEQVLGDHTFAENREEGSFIWENFYDSATGRNTYELTLYLRQGEHYERCEELHVQQSYSVEEITSALTAGGLRVREIVDADTRQAPAADSQRLFFVAQEYQKQKRG